MIFQTCRRFLLSFTSRTQPSWSYSGRMLQVTPLIGEQIIHGSRKCGSDKFSVTHRIISCVRNLQCVWSFSPLANGGDPGKLPAFSPVWPCYQNLRSKIPGRVAGLLLLTTWTVRNSSCVLELTTDSLCLSERARLPTLAPM